MYVSSYQYKKMGDSVSAQLRVVFFILTGTVSMLECQPSSGGSAGSSGTINNGTVDLSNNVISGYINNQFQSQASSLNSAFGTSVHLSGSASANADSFPGFGMDTADIIANSGANSNGNGATGSVSNLDQTNSSTVNGLAVIGQSQITGTGTALNVNSNANANAYSQNNPTDDSGKGRVHLSRGSQGALNYNHRQKSPIANINKVSKTVQSRNRVRSDGRASGDLNLKSNSIVRNRQRS